MRCSFGLLSSTVRYSLYHFHPKSIILSFCGILSVFFLILHVDDEEVKALCDQMQSLANQWEPDKGVDSFGTNSKENETRGDYFLESASKVHFFAEPSALVDGNNQLKPEYQVHKIEALNKAGHAMHIIPGSFRNYALSNKVQSLVLDLGWQDPVVPQSMYIFKQKLIGGPVTSHQDSTFLFTHPKQSCLGLWLGEFTVVSYSLIL